MRVSLAIILLAGSVIAIGQEQRFQTPKLLDARALPVAMDGDILQRQYDALARMQLQTIEYSAQGPVQSIDGWTGLALAGNARMLKKGDSGAEVLQQFKDLLLAAGSETLEVRYNNFVDASTRNLTLAQSIHGIPVLFSVVTVEYNDTTGEVTGFTALFVPDRDLPSKPALSAPQAEQLVSQFLEVANDSRAKQVEIDEGTYLGYFVNVTEPRPPSLAWVVRATLAGGDREDFIVDAMTGEILYRAPAESSALFRTVYDVHNTPNVPFPSIPNQYKLATLQDIQLNDVAWLAYDNIGKAYNDLSNRFPTAANKFPQTVRIVVNWPFLEPNAKWSLHGSVDYFRFSGGTQNKYSYGNPVNIVAHEFAHGFNHREVLGFSGSYSDNQSEALKESFADIMGTVVDIVEAADPGPLSPIWVHGHGLHKASSENGSRSFRDPKGDPRVDAASRFWAQDWFPKRLRLDAATYGHNNSTILSHAYYLLVHGGVHVRAGQPIVPNSTVLIPTISVPAQGEAIARNIFMRAWQDNSMDIEPSFVKMKTAAMQAATALYPGTNASNAAKLAFEAVGVCGVNTTPPPQMTLNDLGDLLCAGRFNPTWNVVPGATQYYAEVAPAQTGFVLGLTSPVTDVDGSTTQCYFQVTQPMFYRIQACNDCGCGPWSQTYYLPFWSPCA